MDQIRQTIAVLGEQIRQSDAYREYGRRTRFTMPTRRFRRL